MRSAFKQRILLLLLFALSLSLAPAARGAGGTTVLDGVDYAAVYDYDYYTRTNPRVLRCMGDNEEAVLRYFVEYGMAEGQQASARFDVFSYRNMYQDLRLQYGNDLKRYYLHYIYTGKAEGRRAVGVTRLRDPVTKLNGVDYAAVYDYEYYTQRNPDIYQLYNGDDVAILDHFVRYGMDAGEQGSANFDVRSYRYQYQDLRLANGKDYRAYYMHYIYAGKAEGRTATGVTKIQDPVTVLGNIDYSPVYDFYYYYGLYPDTRPEYADDDLGMLKHFVNVGMEEGRHGKENYDQAVYEELKEKSHPDYKKARAVLDEIGWDLMAAFRWSASLTYYGHNPNMPDTADMGTIWYADYGFDNHRGNCYVMAATFCEMARLLGYDARQISGSVPLASGGYGPHSWVEIDFDGSTYVFDPDFTYNTGRNGFQIAYGQSGTWRYQPEEVME